MMNHYEVITPALPDNRARQFAGRRRIIPRSTLLSAAYDHMALEPDPKRRIYAYLEAIYDGTMGNIQPSNFLPGQENEPLDWIAARAPKVSKFEAAHVPIAADILGYSNRKTIRWITGLTQILWTVISEIDNISDQTPSRSGEPALYAQHGVPEGIRIPLYSMVSAIGEIAKHKGRNNLLLVEKVSQMLTNVYAGDSGNDRASWDDDFGVFEKNMKLIAQVIAWFPRYAVLAMEKHHAAGEALANYLETFGCMLLVNNDFDDLEDGSHHAGNDIGQRVNTYMWAFNRCEEIPEGVRAEFRNLCDNRELRRKRNAFEPLGDTEKEKVARALEIGRAYKTQVASLLWTTMQRYKQEADGHLHTTFSELPAYDDGNFLHHGILRECLDSMFARFQTYGGG